MFDVVTIGETMLRLSPDAFLRWEQAERLQIHIGGSESNTAVGLTRLGLRVCWLSRLTDNDFGRRISRTIAAQGVDTQFVQWTPEDRVGTYFYEEASPPRESRVIYDRKGSAFTRFSSDQLPKDFFVPGRSKYLHVTGISLAVGETTRDMIFAAVTLAKQAGWMISFDVNYRSKLWSIGEARRVCQSLIDEADIVFIPRRDAIQLCDRSAVEDSRSMLSYFSGRRNGKLTILSMGSEGAAAQANNDYFYEAVTPVPPIGRLGGGDAFSAGFLYGYLTEMEVAKGLKWATAAAAVKYSIPGDLPLFQRAEVQALVTRNQLHSDFR